MNVWKEGRQSVFFWNWKETPGERRGRVPCTSDEWPSKGETRWIRSAVGSVSSASEGGRPFENGAESSAAVVLRLSLKRSVVTPAPERKEASGSVQSRRQIACLWLWKRVAAGTTKREKSYRLSSVRASVCVCCWRGWRRDAVLSVLSNTEKIKSPNGTGCL